MERFRDLLIIWVDIDVGAPHRQGELLRWWWWVFTEVMLQNYVSFKDLEWVPNQAMGITLKYREMNNNDLPWPLDLLTTSNNSISVMTWSPLAMLAYLAACTSTSRTSPSTCTLCSILHWRTLKLYVFTMNVDGTGFPYNCSLSFEHLLTTYCLWNLNISKNIQFLLIWSRGL